MAASNAIGSGEGRSFRWFLRQVGDVALHHVGGALGVENSLAKFVHFGDLCGAAIGGLGAASLNESPAPDVLFLMPREVPGRRIHPSSLVTTDRCYGPHSSC